MRIRDLLEYVAYRVSIGLFRRVPYAVLCPILERLGTLMHSLGLRRRVVETNLSVALGREATPGKVREMARRCYAEHGRVVAEILREERFVGNPDESFRVTGIGNLGDATAAGRGVIILTAHLGNIVLAGYRIARMGYPLAYVSKPVHNPALRVELEKVYTKYGNTIIPIQGFRNDPKGGIRIFKSLRQGGVVVVINDQDAGPTGYMSEFLGVPTSIPSGPAHFAYRTGAIVITSFVTRSGGKIHIDLQAPIDYSRAKTREEAEALILDEYSRRLEAKVRETPELYFWFHKKWKSVPEIQARYRGTKA
jgi:KDO2-lipid IV(A) lauroyltransferase